MLDGALKVKNLVKLVQKQGMNAVALTDHGNMFGAISFYKAAKEAGVKSILGAELEVVTGAHGHHLPLLAAVRLSSTRRARTETPAAWGLAPDTIPALPAPSKSIRPGRSTSADERATAGNQAAGSRPAPSSLHAARARSQGSIARPGSARSAVNAKKPE